MSKTVLSAAERALYRGILPRLLLLAGKRADAAVQGLEDLLDLDIALTNSFGTPGAATHTTPAGIAGIAIGAASVVITNPLITADTVVIPVLMSVDATLTHLLRAVPAAGQVTIVGNANATAATKVGYVALAGIKAQ